jgi:hypothetical protein
MNPFETGIVSSVGFNATSTRQVAAKGSRTVQGRDYLFFYNPMWGFLGDHQASPPGTYYYGHAEHVCYHWNAFDQVLVRPALIDRFQLEDLKILTDDGIAPLVRENGLPDAVAASDHLPIVFALNLERMEPSYVPSYA